MSMRQETVTIETNSLTGILTDLAYCQAALGEAQQADHEWHEKLRTERDRHESLRERLHDALGLTVALTDDQLVEQVAALTPAPALEVDPAVTRMRAWPAPEQDAQDQLTGLGRVIADAFSQSTQAPDPHTETMSPVPPPHVVDPVDAVDSSMPQVAGLTGRRWNNGDLEGQAGLADSMPWPVPLAVATPGGEVWDWAGHGDNGGDFYANPTRSELLLLTQLLMRFGTVYEVKPAETAAETAAEAQGAHQ